VEWAAWASKLRHLKSLGFDPGAPERQKIQTSVWIFLCLLQHDDWLAQGYACQYSKLKINNKMTQDNSTQTVWKEEELISLASRAFVGLGMTHDDAT